MKWQKRREAARAVLAGSACIHPASVHDPLTGRIAESLGFELGMFAGSIASLTVLAAPDLITLTLTEFAEQALRINRACTLPLVVDADHGYGNALNVMRTVEELALECGVTQVHVSRLFQRFAQTGAYQFLLRLKMNDAAELLDNGLLVKEVAERLGFADAFQFSRAFKRVQGVSPTRFQATRLSELFFDVVKKRVRA